MQCTETIKKIPPKKIEEIVNQGRYIILTLERVTCLLRNLYAGQEATVRTGHVTTDWFQIG